MSGSSRNPESWRRGEDFWIFLPTNLSDSLNPRARTIDPWWSERPTRVPTYDLDSFSFPIAPASRPLQPFLLLDEYDPYRRRAAVATPPPYFQSPPRDTQRFPQNIESFLSQEDQTKALNNLRKQFYSPHISSIVKRLGTKSDAAGSFKSADDYSKRCAICLDDFESNKYVTVTPCDHMFHEECIVPWVKSKAKCPVCRYAIAEENGSRRRMGAY